MAHQFSPRDYSFKAFFQVSVGDMLVRMGKVRIDVLLLERGLVESREHARRLLLAGEVRVNDHLVDKAARKVDPESRCEIIRGPRFVSRGGEKLEAALKAFEINVKNSICLDVGSSTGGFTDCLIQRGAKRVYSVDVGKGQLHWKLREDTRVVVMEEMNARYLEAKIFDATADFACVDVSFISLTKILPAIIDVVRQDAQIIALIKPQFEAGRENVEKGGVVRDKDVRRRVVDEIRRFGSEELDLYWKGVLESPLKGPAGNVEYLAYWKRE